MDSPHSSTVVTGYRIDGTLGEGGMGTVYRATQLSLERVVALKVLTAELSADPDFRERFRREGLLQAALEHPHIVTVFEAGEADNRLFLAMRMVEGPTLKDLILRRQLDDRRALRLLTQVAEALDAAHAKGLIHRDVKPQNVLVGAGDHAYLADFGLTKGHDDAGMTETGQFVGTIDYISPEQARGDRATARSDVYALTAVLCECLTGQVPYVRATEERALLAHLTEPPPRLSEVRSDLPAAMDEVVAEGMAKDPADRPASAGELMLKARRALGAPEAPAPRDTPDTTDTTRLRPTAGTPTRTRGMAPTGDLGATRLAGSAAAADATRVPGATPAVPAGAADAHTFAGAQPPVSPKAPASAGAQPGGIPTKARAAAGAQPAAANVRAGTGAGRGRYLLAILAAAAVAAVAGFLLGGSSGGSGEALSDSASAGYVELSFPASWQRLASAPAIPGLRFSQPLALAPSAGASGSAASQRLVAGEVSASGPTLLPAAFTAGLAGALPRPEAVRLGALQAYRYSGLSVHGLAGPLTLYTVPTSGGVATVACLSSATYPSSSSSSSSSPASQCAQIAATLRLNGTTVYGLAPSPAYASELGGTLGALRAATGAGSAKLRAASSASAQAAAAAQLAAAYSSAGRALGRLTVSPAVQGVNANVAGSLAALGRDYSALAAAARNGDEAAYARAASAVGSDRARAASALAALRQAGYAVSG